MLLLAEVIANRIDFPIAKPLSLLATAIQEALTMETRDKNALAFLVLIVVALSVVVVHHFIYVKIEYREKIINEQDTNGSVRSPLFKN